MDVWVGICSRCQSFIRPTWTTSVKREGDVMLLEWTCKACSAEGTQRLAIQVYDKLVADWRAQQKDKSSNLEAFEIGVRMKGFRLDLDVINTVADLALYWDYQERTDPDSIPIELTFPPCK